MFVGVSVTMTQGVPDGSRYDPGTRKSTPGPLTDSGRRRTNENGTARVESPPTVVLRPRKWREGVSFFYPVLDTSSVYRGFLRDLPVVVVGHTYIVQYIPYRPRMCGITFLQQSDMKCVLGPSQ